MKASILFLSTIAATTAQIVPEISLISPIPRLGAIDLSHQPCGDSQRGAVHFQTTPGSRNYVAWKVAHSAPLGNCTLRLGTGPDESDFKVLLPLDKTANKNGSFPCGREETSMEGKEFKFPKNFTCDECTLQLEWTYAAGGKQMHHCADVQVIDKEVEECAGKCQGEGICMNGECKCRKGYSGAYCQDKDSENSSVVTAFYYFTVFLVIVVVIVGLFYGAIRLIRNTEEQKRRLAEAERNANSGEMDQIIDKKSGEPSVSSKFNIGGGASLRHKNT